MKRFMLCAITTYLLLLTGCSDTDVTQIYVSEGTTFNLIYDNETKIIYIDNKVHPGDGHVASHIYTPYYSENGKLCVWRDGEIIELEEE